MVLVAVAAQSVLKAADADEAIVRERISLLFESGSQQDGSYIERVNATRTAWESFRSSPLVGIGPGAAFTYAAADGQVVITRNIDTPILLLARFGLVGLVWVADLRRRVCSP